jgi:hypothetical protein
MGYMEQKLQKKRQEYVSQGLSKDEINKRLEQVRLSYVSKPSGAKNKTGKSLVTPTRKQNPYLAALLDPEHHEPYGVPDEFGRLVHRCKVITQRKMTFLDGASQAIVRPTLQGLLQTTTDQSVAPTVFDVPFSVISGGTLIQNGRRVDHYAGGGPALYPWRNRKFDQTGGSSYLFWDPPHDDEGNPSPIAAVTINGSVYKALICSATTVLFNLEFDIVNPSGVSVTPYIRVWDGNTRTTLTGAPATTTIDTTRLFSFTSQTHIVEYGLEGGGAAGEVEIRSISYTMNLATPAAAGTMETYNIGAGNDFELLQAAGRTYRVSALSCWVIYTGALTSNGQLASAYIETRDDPQATGLLDYANLSVIPNSYVGPLSKGSYTFWEPTGIEDVKFRDINDFDQTLPFIAVSALANSVEAQEVTLRIAAHVEIQTTNQILAPRPSHINPVLVWDAFDVIRTITNSMENDTHLQKIAKIIAKGLNYAGNAAGMTAALAGAMGQPEFAIPFSALATGAEMSAKVLNKY